MSATGSGVTLIYSNQLDGYIPPGSPPSAGSTHAAMAPVLLPPGTAGVRFYHYVGKKAFQVLVSDANGNLRPQGDSILVSQTLGVRPAPDVVYVQKTDAENDEQWFVSIRWQENSTEASLVTADSSAISFVYVPG